MYQDLKTSSIQGKLLKEVGENVARIPSKKEKKTYIDLLKIRVSSLGHMMDIKYLIIQQHICHFRMT